ncbi:MAG: MFS transporter, partial [bacterium]|nr:MFS transporter [bacterium]
APEVTTIPRRQLFLLFATVFLMMLGFGVIIPVLPFFARDLGASPFHLGLMVSVWALAQLLCAPLWGAFSDRAGRKPALMLGLGGFGVTFLLMGMARSVEALLFARALGGVLSAACIPAATAYVADVTDEKDRGQAMAFMGAAFTTGFIVGPALGGLLAPLGVRVPFLVAGALGLAAGLQAHVILPETRKLVPLAGTRAGGPGDLLLAARSPGAVFFGLAFANAFAASSMFTMLSFFLMDRFGGGTAEAGVTFTLLGVTITVLQSLVVGRAIRRAGEFPVIQAGLVLAALGYLGIALAPSLGAFFGAVILASAGMAFTKPPLIAALSRVTTLPQGATMGLLASADSLGRVVGPLWAGFIFGSTIAGPYYSAAAMLLVGLGAFRLFLAAPSGKIPPAVTYNT